MVDERAGRQGLAVSWLHTLVRKLRLRPLEPGKPESNVDAEASAGVPEVAPGVGYPPGYVQDYDDGRLRH